MKLTLCKRYSCLFLAVLLAGCGSNLAPVTELTWHSDAKYQKKHRVKRGETLYAIAFHYDTDYRSLARLNHISPPYTVKVGQVLNVQGMVARRVRPVRPALRRNVFRPARRVPAKALQSPMHQRGTRSASGWLWPVSGRVVISFIPEQGKKGINIACKSGEKVIASSGGVVAYAGSGLAGYGNLIIIKHNNQYLTAYGNNARMLVKEGQNVRAGQIIAEAGVIERKYTGLHFEIRKAGVPVNPLNYLQKG